MLADYKSPYGKPYSIVQRNRDHWLIVDTGSGYRYFHATNWTHFEKDLATEITEDEYGVEVAKYKDRLNEILQKRNLQ